MNEEIKIIIKAIDNATSELKKIAGSAKNTSEETKSAFGGIKDVALGIISANVIQNIAGQIKDIGVGAITSAMDFQKGMQLVGANLNLSSTQIQQVSDDVKQLMATSPSMAKDLQEAFRTVGSEGFNVADSMTLITAANQAAIATGDNVANVSQAIAVSLHDYGASAKEATQYLGYMHGAMVSGNMTMAQLSPHVGELSAKASLMGVSFKDVISVLSMMTAKGIDVAESTTSISNAMLKIVKPSKQAQEYLDSLGKGGQQLVKDFTPAGLAARGLGNTLADIMNVTGGDPSKLYSLMPELRALRLEMAFGKDGAKQYANTLKTVESGQGDLAIAEKQASNNLANQWQTFLNNLQLVGIAIGEKLLPKLSMLLSWVMAHKQDFQNFAQEALKFVKQGFQDIKEAIGWVIDRFNDVKKNIEEHKTIWTIIEIIVGTVALAWTAYAINLATVAVITGIASVATGIFGAVLAVATSPITLIALAVGVLIAVLYLLVTHWSDVTKFLQNVWNAVSNWVISTFTSIGKAIGGFFSGLGTNAHNALDSVLSFIGNIWNAITGFVNNVINIGAGIFNGIVNGVKTGINFVIDLLNNVLKGINTTVIDTINHIPGVSISHIGTIPHLETGGKVLQGGWAVVGERGPELVNLPSNSTVYSNKETQKYNKGSKGQEIHIHNNYQNTNVDMNHVLGRMSYQLRTLS